MSGAWQVAAGAVFLAGLGDAGLSDLRRLRIPNRDSLALLLGFALWAPASGLGGAAFIIHCAAGAAVFAVGVALFAVGAWGGGDAKLLAAVAVWAGFDGLPRLLAVMAVAGGGLALAVLVLRRLPASKDDVAGSWRPACLVEGHVPYGVAIAAAGVDWWLGAAAATFAG